MMVLVSGATATVRRLSGATGLGVLVTPRARQDLSKVVASGMPWAADNDCFLRLDAAAYRRMAVAVAGLPRLLWVACPDVVADHAATVRRWRRWRPYLARLGLPAAFVCQNGCTPSAVPWGELSAVFIGGDTAWKLGAEAAAIIVEARRRGVWVHIGRVNSARRERHFLRLGADSFDGTQHSMFPDTHIPATLRRLSQSCMEVFL